jgi:hypothetical protein
MNDDEVPVSPEPDTTTETPDPTPTQLMEQKILNRTPSNTIPIVAFWMVELAAVIIWRIFVQRDIFDAESLVWIAAAATICYMTGGHIDSILKNRCLPSGIGKIEDISRYKVLVFAWIALSAISMLAYFIFNIESLPTKDITIVSGVISVEYIAGNRANKVATTL